MEVSYSVMQAEGVVVAVGGVVVAAGVVVAFGVVVAPPGGVVVAPPGGVVVVVLSHCTLPETRPRSRRRVTSRLLSGLQ